MRDLKILSHKCYSTLKTLNNLCAVIKLLPADVGYIFIPTSTRKKQGEMYIIVSANQTI